MEMIESKGENGRGIQVGTLLFDQIKTADGFHFDEHGASLPGQEERRRE